MNNWKEKLMTNWHLMRMVRLGIGVMMLVVGIQNKDWPVGLFSLFFLYQAVADTGCCGTQGCGPVRPNARNSTIAAAQEEVIEFEEVK